jgi:hypothetical protein
MSEQMVFEKWEEGWKSQLCPICETKTATSHGWVYLDPAPRKPQPDIRRPVDEVFLHKDGTECSRRRAATHI